MVFRCLGNCNNIISRLSAPYTQIYTSDVINPDSPEKFENPGEFRIPKFENRHLL